VESRFFVQLDGFDQRCHLPREHGGLPRQSRRHLLWLETDLSPESHPPTPSDLIAGINRVKGMFSDTIKVCERVKRPRRTSSSSNMPLGLRNAAHVASRHMKHKIQIESRTCVQDRGSCRNYFDEPCPIHKNPKHTTRQCRVLKKFR
jgi:hypothetical protein